MVYSLRDFGSYTVGGHVHEVTDGEPRKVQFTRTASYTYDPRGHFAVEQTYVQYFVPDKRRDAPPFVLVHGGGMHGSTWETTPDGRPGWLHLLLDQGYEVHVVDLVERGRSGFVPGYWPDDPILRSAEESWLLFRLGAAEDFAARRSFEGAQFPIAAFDAFARSVVPRWLSTTPAQTAGLVAVLDRLGGARLICHSQGGEIAFDSAAARPGLVEGILAVEPSAFPSPDLRSPLAVLAGDYLHTAAHWEARNEGWRSAVSALKGAGCAARYVDTAADIAPGGSHFLMMDRHCRDVLASGLDALGCA